MDRYNGLCIYLVLDSSVGLWVGIQSAGELVSETSQLRILHSTEKDNWSPFDSKIACLCQSIENDNNKQVYPYSYFIQSILVKGPVVSFALYI